MDPLDAVEFVKTKADRPNLAGSQPMPASGHNPWPAIIIGNRSITLGDRYVIYRNVVAGQRVLTILPFWSIDSFAVKAFRSKWVLFLTVSCIVGSVCASLGLATFSNEIPLPFWDFRLPLNQVIAFLLWLFGMIALGIYALYPQAELVIHNQSGKNRIRFVLPRKVEHAIEQFVAQVEAQMNRV